MNIKVTYTNTYERMTKNIDKADVPYENTTSESFTTHDTASAETLLKELLDIDDSMNRLTPDDVHKRFDDIVGKEMSDDVINDIMEYYNGRLEIFMSAMGFIKNIVAEVIHDTSYTVFKDFPLTEKTDGFWTDPDFKDEIHEKFLSGKITVEVWR